MQSQKMSSNESLRANVLRMKIIFFKILNSMLNSGGFRRGSGVQLNPHWSPNYLTFMMNFEKMLANGQIEPYSANLKPMSKKPGSALFKNYPIHNRFLKP